MSLRALALSLTALLLSTSAFAQDSDQDGVPDSADVFPCDSTVSAEAFAPGRDVHGMILMEDQWPAFGDLDTNDVVATYNYAFGLDELGRTRRVRLTINVLAIGGLYDNGLGVHLPISRSAVGALSLTVEGGAPVSLAPSTSDGELTVVLQANLRALFGDAPGQINSRTDLARLPGARMVLDVELATPTTISLVDAPYDIFLFRSADPGHEIHRPRYDGTSRMNNALFGTLDDGSLPGRRFVDGDGIPAIILLPQATPYPAEGRYIWELFPNIITFGSSGGTSNVDFYTSNVQSSAQYVDVNGAGAPAPRAAPFAPVDTSCIPQTDLDGDGFTEDVDCDDTNAQRFPGNPEICDGLDNDCNQMVDDGLPGVFRTYYYDADGDGSGDPSIFVSACGQPPGYVPDGSACTNGSTVDCNVAGSTLIPSSAYVDTNPPAGWRQCAGFVNTNGNDVAPNFLDNCLAQPGLRVIVTNVSTGQVEEDVQVTNLGSYTTWPSFGYLGGTLVATTRTNWGTTTFFATNDGRDACGHSVSTPGSPTFGSGNGSRAIIVGYGTNANEYRVNCNGASMANRRVAIYATDTSQSGATLDCDDADALNFPGNAESCDGQDNDCDGQIDEGNPESGAACSTGMSGLCSAGATQCISGGLVCQANNFGNAEVCGDGQDNDCDGQVDEPMCANFSCSNGSTVDCNIAGGTLISSSAYVDTAPPAGWTQCAGFLNTNGNDVTGNFLDNCLNSNRLRVIVTNASTGQVEEDVWATNLNAYSAWPSWNYLGGNLVAGARTYWGTTTYFTTTDGRDACGHPVGASGQPTFGSGNGSRAIIVGHANGGDEYRVNCNGVSLVNRRVAIYR